MLCLNFDSNSFLRFKSGELGTLDVVREERRVARLDVGRVLPKGVQIRYGWLHDRVERKKIVEVESGACGGNVDVAGIRKSLRLLARIDTVPARLELLGRGGGIVDKGIVVGGRGIHGGL